MRAKEFTVSPENEKKPGRTERDKEIIFFIIHNETVMRKIIADFIRQMVRDGEIPIMAKMYELHDGEEALRFFEMLFKSESGLKAMYKDEPVIPQPGLQRNAIAICDLEMGPMRGVELARLCTADEVFCEISFAMITHEPDIGIVSELGELGVYHILVEPLTLERFAETVLHLAWEIRCDERFYRLEAERLLHRGEYAEALELIEEMGSKYSSLKWTILRGRAYLGLNEPQKAASSFTQAEMGAHIASVIALKHLVELYEAIGDTENIVCNLSKLTKKSPNNKDRKLKLAELYTDNCRFKEAKEVLDALAKDKCIPTEAKMRIANLFEKGGFAIDAANLRIQMVENNLDDYVLCNNLAINLRKQGEYELAEESYLKILKAHPDEAVIWFNRGVNLSFWGKMLGDATIMREGMEHLRTALKLDPHLKGASDAVMRLKADMMAPARV
jgi:tetratricopeptide (TPR) repeat protein